MTPEQLIKRLEPWVSKLQKSPYFLIGVGAFILLLLSIIIILKFLIFFKQFLSKSKLSSYKTMIIVMSLINFDINISILF